MKKSAILYFLLTLLVIGLGCQKEPTFAPEPMTAETAVASFEEQVALQLIQQSGWEVTQNTSLPLSKPIPPDASSMSGLISLERQMIGKDIVHYRFHLQLSSDPYNVIGIHRVVKEKRPLQPLKTDKTIFFLHGDYKDFEGMFLPGIRSAGTSDDFGIAVYLAQNNVDVWGIDQAWTLVPEGVTDFTFMADWGLQKQVDDLRIAMAVARLTRILTGGGSAKLILCGYSSGVTTGYALLNEETRIPERLRLVQGFIAAELGAKFDDPYMQEFMKASYDGLKGLIANGQYQEDVIMRPLSQLARTDPGGDSPMMPGLTNLQAALFLGAGQIFGEGANFHYLAANFEEGFPTGFQLVTNEQWFDFLAAGVPYEPLQFEVEQLALLANIVDVPFDDHFSQIRVPVFNLGVAGGIGELSIYGTTLLGSSDITNLIVSIGAPSLLEDFGHIDMFIAHNAPTLVWQPILSWIEDHSISLFTGTNDLNFENQ